MTRWRMEQVQATLAACELRVGGRRPWLLFDAGQAEEIRRRAAERDGVLDRVRKRCEDVIASPLVEACPQWASSIARGAATVAEGFFLLQEPRFAAWAKARMESLYDVHTWMAPCHGEGGGPDSHADHVMTNVASALVRAHDLLGDACGEVDTALLAERIRDHCVLQFLFSTRTRAAWWAWEDWRTNWKIMCCGETGLAVCALADRIPETRETLWLCARGVIETLDAVPPEGDWEEGITYWFITLQMGLRFARALKRLTGGAVDLFDHPALHVTGDYAMMTTTPSGRLFDFNDNQSSLEQGAADAVLQLALTAGRGDWLATARRFPSNSPLWLAMDDPDLPVATPDRTAQCFPTTGIATMRTGWGREDVFVGIKSSPSKVSHGHMDGNSFVLEAKGKSLLIDEGTWRYASHIGSGDFEKLRWNFDALSSVGHNTLLIDGAGQSCGEDRVGRILSLDSGHGWDRVVAEAGALYPGRLKTFRRTLLLVHPDILVIRDVVECQGERRAEWLLHYDGGIRSEEVVSIVENEGVRLVVTPLLPDRRLGWRVSDVTRTSHYQCHDTLEQVRPSVRYRSFAPFRAAESFEFLFALRVDGDPTGADWRFECGEDGWSLRSAGADWTIRPDAESLRLEGAGGG